MAKPYDLKSFKEQAHLIPQAVFTVAIAEIAKRFGMKVQVGNDEFDSFEGIALFSESGWPFALMHYRGYPPNTSAVYLPEKISDVDQITKMVSAITAEIEIAPSQLEWQRKDDPDL